MVRQPKFDWCRGLKTGKYLPFDFLVDDSIIIELDGIQHFEQVSNWDSPLITQAADRYKEICAKRNGYTIIRLLQEDVWDDTFTHYTSPSGKVTTTTWQSLLTMVLCSPLDGSYTTLITTQGSWPGICKRAHIIHIFYETSINFLR